jgi:TonB-linked SusC/RagA family outer membrane protein
MKKLDFQPPRKFRQYMIVGLLFISSMLTSFTAYGQATINGVVKDDKGQPLFGAGVYNQNTKQGTTTDNNGKFTITASTNDVLSVSFLGMDTYTVTITEGLVFYEVTLNVSAQELQSVVVTALGIKREEKALGYSVQNVSGEDLQNVSGVDVATSLTGKVAGLLVSNSPDFGATPNLLIRGEQPLIVIDNVPYQNKSLSDVPSEDIESVSVLKGATASALYGYRGANGAIIISTKKGKESTGLTVDFTSNTMFTAGFLALPEKQSLYGRGSNNTYNINSDAAWGVPMDGRVLNQWDPIEKVFKDMPYLPVGADNFKNFLEQGYVTNNNVSIAVSKENISIRSSFNYIDNKGQYPNSSLKKYTYTFGGDLDLGKFKMSTNLSYAKKASPNLGSNGYTSYDPMYTLLIWSTADFNILDYKDNYWITKGVQQNNHFGFNTTTNTYTGANQNNPYFNQYEKTNEMSRDIFTADVSLSYQVTPWLNATLRSGLDFYKEVGQIRVAMSSYVSSGNTPIPGNLYTWVGGRTGGYAIGQSSGFSSNTDFMLTGEKSLEKFNFEYLAGGTVFYYRDDVLYAATSGGLTIPEYYSIKASVNTPVITPGLNRRQVNSIYGRLAVSWNRLIYLEATAREDYSSTLSETQRAYFYPSVSSSFVISELLPGTKNWLDFLKLRASYSISKNMASVYEINSTYSITSNTWNTLSGASVPSALYPNDITPSAANTFETGIQSKFFKNRLSLDVAYFDKKMYDAIITGSISPASGYSGVKTNSDEIISRRGWEVIINGTPIRNNDWQLDLGIMWSTYKRVWTQLDSIYTTKRPWIAEGERVDVFYSRDFLRNPETGELIFNNGRLVTSGYDSKFGYSDPDWLWGFTANLKYKSFTLAMSFDGVVGGLTNTRTESYLWQSGNHPNSLTPERALDVATPGSTNFLGQGVRVVSGTVTYDAFGNITSDTRVYAPNDIYTTYRQYAIDSHNSSAWGGNGSPNDTYSKTFFKLREISLTYVVPQKFLGKVAKFASISFIGQNVFLKAKEFKYTDPDGGRDDFADPSVRYLGFKFNISL